MRKKRRLRVEGKRWGEKGEMENERVEVMRVAKEGMEGRRKEEGKVWGKGRGRCGGRESKGEVGGKRGGR